MDVAGQKVYFQDAKDMDQVPDESVTLVVTSPPYWNVRDYGGEQIGFGQSYREYIDSLNAVWTECLRVLQPNGKFTINVQPLPIPGESSGYDFRVICDIMHDIETFFREHDCFLSGMIFWNKAPYVNNVSWGSYPKPTNIATNTSFEQIYTFVKRGATRKVAKPVLESSLLTKDEWRHWAVRCVWDDIAPVIKINAKGENIFGHGAPFPEDIPYRLMRMHTAEGETVLDPFLGSGTTLKIARLFKRKGIGYELNKEFEPLIRERVMEDWTPPLIEPHYRSIGNETMARILGLFHDIAIEGRCNGDDAGFYDTIIDALRKSLPDLFSSAYLKNIKKNLGLTRERKVDEPDSHFTNSP
ncbi:MAG TPA: site-specific DNA-methyltransferase [Candidatus Lokiarchaeia archaeon]|nr:site-specific DNA-methyltransferase [Candidatus Lokiarchaeia archaeon]